MRTAFVSSLQLLLVVLLFSGWTNLAAAQFPAPAESGQTELDVGQLTAEERAELLARLSDEDVREIFLKYLEETRPTSQSEADTGFVESLDETMGAARARLAGLLSRTGELAQVPGFFLERANAGLSSRHIYLVAFVFLVLALIGYGAERLYRRGAAKLYAAVSQGGKGEDNPNLAARFLGHLTLDVIGIAVFALVMLVLFFALYRGHEPTRLLIGALFVALLMTRLGIALAKAVLAPRQETARILPLEDAPARRLFLWIAFTVAFAAFWFNLTAVLFDFGLDRELVFLLRLIGATVLLLLVLLCLVLAWRPLGESLAAKVEPDRRGSAFWRALARQWPVPPMLYLAAVYLVSIVFGLTGRGLGSSPGIWSLLILLLYPLADFLVAGLVRSAFDARFGDKGTHRAVVTPIFVRASRIVVFLLVAAFFFRVWGIEIVGSAEDAVIGGSFAAALLEGGATVLVAYVLWGVAKLSFLRYFGEEAEEGAAADEGAAAAPASRLQTILPLCLRLFQITLIAMVVMIVLSSMGVDIGPLLAGAGVVGIAIGFGAQALVRDMVSGLFFLLDDAFRKGEYVDIGSVKGTVEAINIRSLVLRHHLGPIHTVPFGEIKHLTNFSRDWVIMKLEFRVPTDTDLQKVKKIFKKIGADMLEHPELGKDFIQPFKSQGVKAIEDSAIIVRGKFMARPGRQFVVRKELYNRVQAEFQAAGIEFAHRKVTVELPPDAKLTDEQKQRVAEAAGAAARGIEEPEAQKS